MVEYGSDGRPKPIDLAAARKMAAEVPARRLDSDWLAVDAAGHVAFFAGNEHGPIPRDADVAQVGEALLAIARAAAVRRTSALGQEEAYRGFADRAQDPIFDAPCSARGQAKHERPLPGYPLLVLANDPAMREIAAEWTPREVPSRGGFGLVFPVIGPATYDELHERSVCAGCRVLDDPEDLRPRGAEALAGAGIYVYEHLDDDRAEPYRRIAGPTVAADVADLEPLAQIVASLVKLPVQFENEASLAIDQLANC